MVENRAQSLRILELESKLEEGGGNGSSGADSAAIAQLASLKRELRTAQVRAAEGDKASARLKKLEKELSEAQAEVVELRSELGLVDMDKQEMITKVTEQARRESEAHMEKLQGDYTALATKLEATEAQLTALGSELEALKEA